MFQAMRIILVNGLVNELKVIQVHIASHLYLIGFLAKPERLLQQQQSLYLAHICMLYNNTNGYGHSNSNITVIT